MTEAFNPTSLAEALELLAARPGARLLAGCTDWMVCEPEQRAQVPAAVDVMRIPEIRGIRERDGGLEIGATTTFREIGESADVRRLYPALAEAAAVIGGWQIQNRATIGGNVVNASPAGDSLPVLLVLDAVVVTAGPAGQREIPYRDFHVGYRETALEPGELLGWLRLPEPPPGSVQGFRKVGTREAQAISKVVVAMLGRAEAGVIADLRLAAGSVAPVPVRLDRVEREITGLPVTPQTAELAGRIAAESVTPIDDVRSTAAYRSFALERVVRRMVLDLGGSVSGS